MSRHRVVKRLPSGTFAVVLAGLTLVLGGATFGCAIQMGQAPGGAATVAVSRQAGEGTRRPPTQIELQSELIAFSDRFAAIMVSALAEFEERLPQGSESPKGRLLASTARVYPNLAAVQIATGSNPAASLLDMVTMVTLYRQVWEEHWRAEVFGEAADPVVRALQRLDADIWSIAAGVLTPDQQRELRDLIAQWRQDNPMVLGVTFVRIADFGESRGKSTLLEAAQPGGLLAPVEEATRAAEDIRLLGERTTYLLTRLYALTPFQVDFIYKQLVTQPEIGQLLTGSTRLMETAERLEKAFGQLPAQVTEERTAAIRQLILSVADERRAAIAQALEGMTKERQLTLEQLFKNITTMTEQVVGQISSERGVVIAEVGKTVEAERKALLLGVDQVVEKTGSQGEHLVQYAFVRGVLLIGVFFVALFCYRLAVRRLDGSRRGNENNRAA